MGGLVVNDKNSGFQEVGFVDHHVFSIAVPLWHAAWVG
jgi:hypothetical protein